VKYMSENDVFVDIWDGDSLLHIGVCAIPLKAILRQGRDAVTIDEDIDIIWTDVILYFNYRTRSAMIKP
jgi:nephrocystin-4